MRYAEGEEFVEGLVIVELLTFLIEYVTLFVLQVCFVYERKLWTSLCHF